jgi:hypothetical protein
LIDKIKTKIKDFLNKASSEGISIVFIKDPKTQTASVSLTMMIVSFTIVVVGVIGKLSQGWEIDMSQAFHLLYLTTGLYFGRKISPQKEEEQSK